jgi:4-hydroxybenzoate polyprenyltransferase
MPPLEFSRRLLTVLQLTRMALVFTAISDVLCGLLLRLRFDPAFAQQVHYGHAILLVLISMGLYGFGMSLNDIIDRRRDRQLASHRPLPSGRIGVATAHAVCLLLAVLALVGGFVFWRITPQGHLSFVVLAWCVLLIAFYDLVGKYLVAAGLLSLGLIRFFNASIAQPTLLVPWHPLVLFNHVAILSAVCYVLEQKRPVLNRRHVGVLALGLTLVNAAVIVPLWMRRSGGEWSLEALQQALNVHVGLIYPLAAVAGFVIAALLLRRRVKEPRLAGQQMMLLGLLWLIVYDASFVFGYVGAYQAAIVFAMLPAAYLSVQLMRWWGNLLFLSQKPQYQRAR